MARKINTFTTHQHSYQPDVSSQQHPSRCCRCLSPRSKPGHQNEQQRVISKPSWSRQHARPKQIPSQALASRSAAGNNELIAAYRDWVVLPRHTCHARRCSVPRISHGSQRAAVMFFSTSAAEACARLFASSCRCRHCSPCWAVAARPRVDINTMPPALPVVTTMSPASQYSVS